MLVFVAYCVIVTFVHVAFVTLVLFSLCSCSGSVREDTVKNNDYRWLMQQSRSAKQWLTESILLGTLSGIIQIIQAGILAYIIDQVYLHHANRTTLLHSLFIFLGLIVLRSMTTWIREIVSFKTGQTIKDNVRKNILNKLSACTPLEISQFKTGALTTTLIEQVEALHGFFADYLPQMSIMVIVPLMILIIVFMQNWLAGTILFITAPLIPLFMALVGMKTAKLNQENFKILARMSAHFLDLLQGLSTLVLFNRAEAQVESIKTVSNQFREQTMRILRIAFLSTATLELFATISIAIIAVYLGLGLLGFMHIGFDGMHITLFHALFILLLAPEFFMPLRQLGTFYHARAEALGAAAEILAIKI